ncbi:hypothetical protein COLO4_04426 [Corchorus olitorius]|uniref:Uncharacterized protein n=1 Tax=Corchorus olitorius TaxID=93759 RepID=A0A1R3KU63_9ROSI|nr:hypothetical protein COLO4_04426 [Corchorus olitorius]
MALSIHLFLQKKEFRISPGPGEQIGVGEEGEALQDLPVAVSGPPIPSLPFAPPDGGPMRSDLSK